MFVGEVGLELSAGFGTSIGGNRGVRPDGINPYNGQRKYTRNGVRDGAPRPTVFDSGNTAETVTRHKSGVNFAADCQPCEDSLDLYASVGVSGFISGGVGKSSVGAAFDYPIGNCSVRNGCKLTWQDEPTGSVGVGRNRRSDSSLWERRRSGKSDGWPTITFSFTWLSKL